MYLPDGAALPRPHDDVTVSVAADGLDAIGGRHVALALWPRAPLAIVATVDLDTVDDLSFVMPSASDAASLTVAHLVAGGFPPDAAAIGADIAALAAVHRRITGAAAIAARLDVVDGDGCRRFHADHVSLRLRCTYRGAGTQWCRVAAPEAVHDLATGTIGIFKRRLAMEEPSILHRSPPVRRGGDQRLLLVLDPA